MVFYPPRTFPPLSSVPDSIPISDFMLDERYGRSALSTYLNPFICGISGGTYSWLEVSDRVDYLARGIAKELGWQPNQGTEWDKVIGCFLLNTVNICLELLYLPSLSESRTLTHCCMKSDRYPPFVLGDTSTFWHRMSRQCRILCPGTGLPAERFWSQSLIHMPSSAQHVS